jgi:DNA repair exonuclease SbcCD ATPase subunit
MFNRKNWLVCHVLLITLILACGGAEKEATEAAINAVQIAIDSVSSVAAEYVPDQLKSAEDALQRARIALAKGDYATAMAAAKDTVGKVSEMAKAAAEKKEALVEGWASLSESMSKSLRQLKAKLDAFSHGAKLPFGMDRWQLADAKEKYQQLIQAWALATAAAQQGNLGDAIQKASGIRGILERLMEMVGIKS